MADSINRNIVECKESIGIFNMVGYQCSINRNIVECKELYFRYACNSTTVLIETLWNVKMDQRPVYGRSG